ncbi:MAG: PhoH family protein [Bacteroidales bacterium]|nr:PhoH family protein [Bacteroidales bacterium]
MTEKLISLKGVDPKSLFGTLNKNLNKISQAFPKLKIISRGSDLRVMGDEKELLVFEEKLETILQFLHEHNEITEDDLNLLLDNTINEAGEDLNIHNEVLVYGNSGKPIQARTVNQKNLVNDYQLNDLLLAIGPAGTGKTYTAIALAVRALKNHEVRRIILTRPAVEAGEHLGFLPGDVRDKMDPYLQPLYDALRDMIPSKKLANYMEDETIQIAPLAYMRGRTLENAFVVMDEAQNATLNQLKMFLTRMGANSKFIVTGDITQVDLPDKRTSGLVQAMHILDKIEGISIIHFDERDILRHKLVKYIVRAYDKFDDNSK